MTGRNVTVAAALTLLSLLPASAKSYKAERYDVNLQLDPGGTLRITETAVFHFADGPFTYVYRDLSDRGTDGIFDVSALMDGAPGNADIRGTHVRWHFAPLSNQTHTFTLRYEARGVIRKLSKADTLIWRALPSGRAYGIDRATITLESPEGITPLVALLSPVHGGLSGNRVVFPLEHAGAAKDVVLTARYTPGTFRGPQPRWLVSQSLWRGEFLTGLQYGSLVGLLVLLAGGWWLSRQISTWKVGKPLPPERETVALADALPPVLAGRLAGRAASTQAALLDLAQRGVIRIEQTRPGRFRREFELTRQEDPIAVTPPERVLLDAAFGDGRAISLTRFQQAAVRAGRRFRKAVTQSLVDAGFFEPERLRARSRLLHAGIFLLILAAAGSLATVLLVTRLPGIITGVMTAVMAVFLICAVAVFAASSRISPLSEAGARRAGREKERAAELREVARGHAPLPGRPEWESVLAYGAAFGLASGLMRRAQKSGTLPAPEWFGACQSDDDGGAFVSFMTSSSASYGGGDAGAAASGGGGSGAG